VLAWCGSRQVPLEDLDVVAQIAERAAHQRVRNRNDERSGHGDYLNRLA
jgi:hypothetical protein